MRIKRDPGGYPDRRLAEVPVLAPTEMREVQRLAQEEFSIEITQLTENAGRSAAEIALAMLDGRGRGQRVVVLAGGGNKGAAGLSAVRHLVNWGLLVVPVLAEVESEMSYPARRQIQVLRAAGVLDPGSEETNEFTLEDHLASADLVIDALIGYGREGGPSGMTAAVAELTNSSGKPVLALDLPTGVSAATGEVSQPAIRAVTTLALDLPKRGLADPRSRGHTGELYLTDLGIPRAVFERAGISVGNVFSEGPIVRLRR